MDNQYDMLKVRAKEITGYEVEMKTVQYNGKSTEIKVGRFAKIALPFEKIYHFLNGKKLFIGLAVVGVAFLSPLNPVVAEALKWVGGSIAGIGGGHKIAKAQNKIGEKGKFDEGELVLAFNIILKWIIGKFITANGGN